MAGEKVTIALDYSHNNKLTLEASSYNDFTHFLFSSGYKLGKIQAGMDSLSKLEPYDSLILSTPNNTNLSDQEISVLEEYVKNGGSLLILSSMGSDHTNKTNLNKLTSKFGFEFLLDGINDSVNYINLQNRPLITSINPHSITENIKKLVFSSGCSLKILEFLEVAQNIKIEVIATAGINAWHRFFNGTDWIEEDYPKAPIIVVVEYFKGKVVAFGTLSMFSSLGSEYGFSAFDNNVFIANTMKYLTSAAIHEGKVVTVNLNLDLFYWANKILNEQNWESVSDVINLSLKYFKDNFDRAIEDIKSIREEKLHTKIEYEKKRKVMEESSEDKILEMVPIKRKREDLEDIMSALGEVTGEKYEISIDLEESVINEGETEKEEVEEKEIVSGFKTSDNLQYTSDDAKQFHKETLKNAIWHGKPTKDFEKFLRQKKMREKIQKTYERE